MLFIIPHFYVFSFWLPRSLKSQKETYLYIITFLGVLKTRLDMDTSYSTVDHKMPNYTYVDNKLRLSVTFIYSDDVSKTMVDQFRTW